MYSRMVVLFLSSGTIKYIQMGDMFMTRAYHQAPFLRAIGSST